MDYLCFADWPIYAWQYSAETTSEVQEWDLWLVLSHHVGRITYRGDHKGRTPAELRTWQDIPPEVVQWVASRWRYPGRQRKAPKYASRSTPPTKRAPWPKHK